MLTAIPLEARNPGPMTGTGNHTYLVRAAPRRALLIDAGVGHPEHLAELALHLAAWDANLCDVLVTHAHHDHIAGGAAIAGAYPAARFHKHPWPVADAPYGVAWRGIDEGARFAVDAGGVLEALHTPGHSPDHLVFWHEPSRTLFSGDLVLPGATVVIQWSRGGDMAQYMASLARVAALRPRVLRPAHGGHVEDPTRLLQATLDHRRRREDEVAARVAEGRDTVEAIVESIYDGLAPEHVAAARENVRAHLEKLEADGRVRDDDGRWTPV